jgi:hypothetical protein
MDQKFWLNILAGSLPTILLLVILLLVQKDLGISLGAVLQALITIILALMAGTVLAAMAKGTINLSKLISEDNGNASLSRFQFLVFTFVIAGSYFMMMVLYTGQFQGLTDAAAAMKAANGDKISAATINLQTSIDQVKAMFTFQLPDIPSGVLGLIGLSGGSYVIAKGIQKSAEGDAGPGVASVTVIAGGGGYDKSSHIPIAITGGGGVNASGYASTDGSGAVTSVTVSAPGSGYTAAPDVTIPTASTTGNTAKLQAVLAT